MHIATSSIQLQQAKTRTGKNTKELGGESKPRPYTPLKPLKEWWLVSESEEGKSRIQYAGWKIKDQISEQASHEAHEVPFERKVIEQSKTQETPLHRERKLQKNSE